MPLVEGSSRDVISANIRELMAAGHSQEQAVAIALSKARKRKKQATAMMKAIPLLFFKSLIPAHTRRLKTGKVVHVRQYTDKRTKRLEDNKTLDMFADDDTITEPRKDLIAEHKRLVNVLESPSRKDDKVEAKKQKEELEGYEAKPSTRIINPLTVNIFNPPEHGDTVRFFNYPEKTRDWTVKNEMHGWSLYRGSQRHPTIYNIPAMVDFIRALDGAASAKQAESGDTEAKANEESESDNKKIDAMIARAKAIGPVAGAPGIAASLEAFRDGKNPSGVVMNREAGIKHFEYQLQAAEAYAKRHKAKPAPKVVSVKASKPKADAAPVPRKT